VFGPASGKGMVRHRPGGFARCGCGGAPIGGHGRGRFSRCGRSERISLGARIPPIAATTARSAGRPMNQATGCGGPMASTTSLSRLTTTPGRGWRDGAARCFCMWRGPTAGRPRDASPWGPMTYAACCGSSRQKPEYRFSSSLARQKSPSRSGHGLNPWRRPPESPRSCPLKEDSFHCGERSWR